MPATSLFRPKDRLIGLLIIVLTFIASLGLAWWSGEQVRPKESLPPAPPTKQGLKGFPSVDPVEVLSQARKLTERTMLRGFVAEGVSRDGKVNLSSPAIRVRYAFQGAPGQGAQPARPRGKLPRRHYCGRQNVHLKKSGLVADPDQTKTLCPKKHEDPLPDPQCGTKKVWDRAVKRGASPKTLARIEYYRSRVGPAWRFTQPGTPHRFSLYGDCERELSVKEAAGLVP